MKRSRRDKLTCDTENTVNLKLENVLCICSVCVCVCEEREGMVGDGWHLRHKLLILSGGEGRGDGADEGSYKGYE